MNQSARLAEVTPGTSSKCVHCGKEFASFSNSRFCCAGCASVHEILRMNGLGEYYSIRDRFGKVPLQPISVSTGGRFDYLDEPAFIEVYGERGGTRMRFYLEGVHCAACVWLIEKLPKLDGKVRSVTLNLASKVATVDLLPGGSFSGVAGEFEMLGYRPHPVEAREARGAEVLENRRQLKRIGVAAGCAGNLMLMSVPLYGGATGEFGALFRWASLALFLPVLFYSAAPFFRNAFGALKGRRLSIEVPVAFGILSGSFASVVNLVRGTNDIYFDSLAGLIFLLLSSRYLLRRVQASAEDASHLLHFLTPARASRLSADGSATVVPSHSLLPGDVVEITAGSLVPADGEVIYGTSEVSRSWMTGEVRSESIGPGHLLYSGSLNETGYIRIQVTASGAETRLGEILGETDRALRSRSKTIEFADRLAEWFVPMTFILIAVGFIAGYSVSLSEGFVRALSVAIVVCPCALALAIPLAMSVSIGNLARKGILVRGADVLERLSEIENVFFDKTGTLTTGKLEVLRWIPEQENAAEILVALEARSIHPIADAIRRYFGELPRGASRAFPLVLPEATDVHEILGHGIDGRIGPDRYRIRRSEVVGEGTEISLESGGKRLGLMVLGDSLRPFAGESIKKLNALGLRVGVLSGDGGSAVEQLTRGLDISEELKFHSLSPERKAELLREHPRSLMIGDGANDAIGLASASVGMVIGGGMEVAMRAAGIYCASGELLNLPRLVIISRETLRVIHRALVFTIFYNMVVVIIAVSGNLRPLLAAIFMPASALTVFLLSTFGTRKLRRTLAEVSG